METHCPHCSQGIEIDPVLLPVLRAAGGFDCPACLERVPMPYGEGEWMGDAVASAGGAGPEARRDARGMVTALLAAHRGMNRNLRILGILVLAGLGGLGIFLVLQKTGTDFLFRRKQVNEDVRNRFFADLVSAGRTTKPMLQQMTDIQPWGIGYIGVSRKALAWTEARQLASDAGGEVLLIDLAEKGALQRGPASVQTESLMALLLERYRQRQGTTAWVRDHTGEPRVLDIPDVSVVTTLDRPRPVFVHWRPAQPAIEPFPMPAVRIRGTDPPLSTDPMNPTVLRIGDDRVTLKFSFDNPGMQEVEASVVPFYRGRALRSYGNPERKMLPVGVGEHVISAIMLDTPGPFDEIGVALRMRNADKQIEELGTVAVLPAAAQWLPDPAKWQLELTGVEPEGTFAAATGKLRIRAVMSQKFRITLKVRYRTPWATKLAANLLMGEANILSARQLQELRTNHVTTWHFDTGSRTGYRPVNGDGSLVFDLTGYAPERPGTYGFQANLGLFDQRTFLTVLLRLHEVELTVTETSP
jgi:hypothetical protein